jgi:hypothetical protein
VEVPAAFVAVRAEEAVHRNELVSVQPVGGNGIEYPRIRFSQAAVAGRS